MKISKLFHWLYASLCFLPLLVAPTFALAVRSDNNYQPIEITTGGYEFRNKYETNEVNTSNDLIEGNVYHYDNFIISNDHMPYTEQYFSLYILRYEEFNLLNYSSSYFDENSYNTYDCTDNNYLLFSFNNYGGNNDLYLSATNGDCYITYTYEEVDIEIINVDFYINNLQDFIDFVTNNNTGIGLPTSSDFNIVECFYNEGVVYNDTDVGSQYLYTLYNVTDKYMDFDNVFNLYQVNEWISVNVFNGSVPLIWPIIWHYLDYWLLLSIFWLCFDVLIYVPQLAHRWLDKAALQ